MIWKNIVAVVTGAASGLGKYTAQHILKNGGRVVACDLPTSSGQEIYKHDQDCTFLPCDVRSENEVQSVVKYCEENYGFINVLINSASISRAFKINNAYRNNEFDINDMTIVLETDLVGTFNVIRSFAPLLSSKSIEEEKKSLIINYTGSAAEDGISCQSVIAAAKAGVNAMTLPLAREFAPLGIRVLSVSVGLMESPILHEDCITKAVQEYLKLQTLLRRFGKPEELGNLVDSILENHMLNGEIIRFTGGLRQHQYRSNFMTGYAPINDRPRN